VKNLRESATELLDYAMKAGAEQAVASAASSEGIDASARDGVIEEIGRTEDLDIGIRVIVGQKQACVSASSGKSDVLKELAERAVAMARETPEDPYCGLPETSELATEFPDCDLCDETETDADALRDMALVADNAAREVAGIEKTDGSSASWSRRAAALVASNGFSAERQGSFWGASCTAIAGEGLSCRNWPRSGRADGQTLESTQGEDLRSPGDL